MNKPQKRRINGLEKLLQEAEKEAFDFNYQVISGFPYMTGSMEYRKTESIKLITITKLKEIIRRK